MEIRASFGFALMLLFGVVNPSDAKPLWKDVNTIAAKSQIFKNSSTSPYQQARLLHLDLQAMSDQLAVADVDLPLPDGSLISVKVSVDNLLPAKLSQKFPQIKVYRILPDEFIFSGKLDITSQGFHAMLQTRQGETLFIDPVANIQLAKGVATPSERIYASYHKRDQKKAKRPSCSANLKDEVLGKNTYKNNAKPYGRSPQSLLNYRIAISASGEYTAKHGGTVQSAMSAIVTTLSRVNQVFEQDLGIHLSLVENNDALIYTDASSDPFTQQEDKLLKQNQKNIDSIIGSRNYDIGHLFTTSGGGLAAIGSVCNSALKASGFSGLSNSYSDSFDLDFVAHEIGHQFGATHTFNGARGLCSGDTRTARTAFEPGSGSSIMSYAGYCGQDNLQSNTDAMFHIGSVEQIRSYALQDKGSHCGTVINIENSPPQANAGKDYIIPARTPFYLKGKASDPNGDELVYAWQQIDAGERSVENIDRGNNALFRVHLPSASSERSFPPIKDILSHSAEKGESLPFQQRQMRFKFVVQDGYNTPQSDSMTIQVQRTGSRFAMNFPRSQYTLGATHEIYWNVAKTDIAPINCSSVDVSLSVNGGVSFSRVLAENIPNTGKTFVTIPADLAVTTKGRFKISCSNNIFFALSYRNFKLNWQEHLARKVLADEDKPEYDLEDKNISQAGDSIFSLESSPKQGSGSFSGMLMLFFVILIARREELFVLYRSE